MQRHFPQHADADTLWSLVATGESPPRPRDLSRPVEVTVEVTAGRKAWVECAKDLVQGAESSHFRQVIRLSGPKPGDPSPVWIIPTRPEYVISTGSVGFWVRGDDILNSRERP